MTVAVVPLTETRIICEALCAISRSDTHEGEALEAELELEELLPEEELELPEALPELEPELPEPELPEAELSESLSSEEASSSSYSSSAVSVQLSWALFPQRSVQETVSVY